MTRRSPPFDLYPRFVMIRLQGVLAGFLADEFELRTVIWVVSPYLNLILAMFYIYKIKFERPIWRTPVWQPVPNQRHFLSASP
jgi:hypothetical protein